MKNEKYSAYVLELVRNNGIKALETGEGDSCFLMFDYFDVLICKELLGEDKHYRNYLSIRDTFQDVDKYKVSYKTLSLYRDADDKENPFIIKDADKAWEIPFLGLIQISLCSESYQRSDITVVDVNRFLIDCENAILETTDNVALKGNKDITVRRIYRSSTTGDFCLAVRTDYVENIYNIALALNNNSSKFGASGEVLKLHTYTNVGIVCNRNSNGQFEGPYSDFVEMHTDMVFALRISADAELLEHLQQYIRNISGDALEKDEKLQVVKGLFGRYDYLLHISMEEFGKIYKVLCEKKIGAGVSEDYVLENYELGNILKHKSVWNINERVLVSLDPIQISDRQNDESNQNYYLDQIMRMNDDLYDIICELEKWGAAFSEEAQAFTALFRGMKEIYKAFSSAGAEKETYINWLSFYEDVLVLCNCITYNMENYASKCKEPSFDEDEKRIYRLSVLRDWRNNIQAINQYTRLVQNTNYQTYQSPIYEIQTQIDTAKTMVAYREAMRLYMESFAEYERSEGDDAATIIPVIYPDLSKAEVEVVAPFIHQWNSNEKVTREILCTVPSFEYFGRLYDMLPWVIHEASHNFRVLDREMRNKFVAKYFLSYIFEIIMEDALPRLSTNILYTSLGETEHFLVNCMIDTAVEEMTTYPGFNEFDVKELVSTVDLYLMQLMPYHTKHEGTRRFNEAQKIRDEVYRYYISECRKEGIWDEKITDELIEIKKEEAKEQRDDIMKKLLDSYFSRLLAGEGIDQKHTISLWDMHQEQIYFEKKLLDVAEQMKNAGVGEEAVKEYSYKVIGLYRTERAYDSIFPKWKDSEKNIRNFLRSVYDHYWEKPIGPQWGERTRFLADPEVMHFLGRLGLLDYDSKKSKETFISEMMDIFLNVDYSKIQPDRKFRETVYREACADLLMATSLNLTCFGYCRQVLQTMSDTRMDRNRYQYNEVNNQRFQIVAAVLLEEENNGMLSGSEEMGYAVLNGDAVIEAGVTYCAYTLKCIRGKAMQKIGDGAVEAERKLIDEFIESVNAQLDTYLHDLQNGESYNATLLYCLLHGVEEADDFMQKEWARYQKIIDKFESIKYIFLRLEYFCLGLENIMPNGNIRVPWDIFMHMKSIREKVKSESGFGCAWEQEWECLRNAKKDVGDFYNEPELVFDRTAAQKLETTIDFIQNYYYYNRFKMVQRGNEIVAKVKGENI